MTAFARPATAAPPLDYSARWSSTFATATISHSIPGGIAVDQQGNVYLAATDMVGVRKYGPDGNLLWQRQYGNGSSLAVTVDRFDNVYLTGGMDTGSGNQPFDFVLVKYSAAGELVFGKTFDHYGYYGSANDYATSIVVDQNGRAYLGGYGGYPWSTVFNKFFVSIVSPTGEAEWQSSYSNGNESTGHGIAVDSEGNYLVTGSVINTNRDCYTVKFDAAHTQLWAQTFDGGGDDIPAKAVLDQQRNVYIIGQTNEGGTVRALLLKYDPDGTLLWSRTIAGTYSGKDLAVDETGMVYAIGTTADPATANDLFVAIIAPDGSDVAFQTYPSVNGGQAITVTPDGVSIYTAGDTWKYYHSYGYDYQTTRLDKNGAFVIGTPALLPLASRNSAYALQLSATGGTGSLTWSLTAGSLPPGLTLAGDTGVIAGSPEEAGEYRLTVRVTDAGGAMRSKTLTLFVADPLVITTTELAIANRDAAYSQTLGAVGGVPRYTWYLRAGALPAGLSLNAQTGTIAGIPTVAGTYTVTLAVAGELGTVASREFTLQVKDWQFTTRPGTGPAAGRAIVADAQGNFYVAGSYYRTAAAADSDLVLIKYGAGGNILWQKTHDSGGNDAAHGVALTPEGDLVVTGVASGHCLTRKYAPDGTLLWDESFAAADGEICKGVVVSRAGVISIVGTTTSAGNADYLLLTYAPDGTLVRSTTYDSGDAVDAGNDIAIDAADSLYVTGSTSTGTVTLKYSAAGELLWTRPTSSGKASRIAVDPQGYTYLLYGNTLTIYDPAGQFYYSRGGTGTYLGVAVDDRQHVYITGIESNGQNIFTERTHRQEGNIWYRTHDAGGVDKGHALFVDQQGVVYVTGESLNGTSGSIVSLVYAQPRLQTLVLPEGTAGTLYAFPVPVAGGLAPYTWTLSSSNGSLPNGFSINSATGELGGMPDEGGTFSFTVKVTGQQGLADLVRYQLKIAGSPARPLTVTVDNLPTPTYTWYDRILTGAGGTLPYTWSIGSGSLPPGLNFYPDGRLQGYVPNGMTGYFSFAVRITDGDGLTVDKPFVFAILPLYPGYYCRLQHDPTALYGTIAAALQAIPDAGTLQMKTALLSGDMDCTRPVAITVRGGYADDYGAQTGMTTVMGTLTVTAGSVTVENLVLM